MRAAIHSFLAILHFWTFFLCPSLHAGQEKYRIEVGVFEDDNNISESLRTGFEPLTSAEIKDAHGYYLNVFVSRPSEEGETEEMPWVLSSYGAVYKPCFSGSYAREYYPYHRVIRNYDDGEPFSYSFLEGGKLNLTLPESFKDKIEVISPFSVITHIIDRKRFYPPFGEDDPFSFEFPKLYHTFEFFSPSNDNDPKGVLPFRTINFQQKEFENSLLGWTIGGTETNAPWEKIKWEAEGMIENTARYLSQYVDVKAQSLINKGAFLAKASAKVETSFLDNRNGEIKGEGGTQVIIQNQMDNTSGVIGSDMGEMHLELSPAFNQTNEDHTLGKIEGSKLYVHGNGFQGLLGHGELIGKKEIHLLNSNPFILKDVDVCTDLLTLNIPEFQSDKSPTAQKTRFLVGDYETFRLSAPYVTEGVVEFWEKGFDSPILIKEMLQNRPHTLEPRDTAGKTIQIFAPLKAAKISAYTPDYKLHAKHGCIGDAALDVKDGDFRAYVRSFDLEEGLGVAKNAEIIASNGIRIGDLAADFNTNCLEKFYPWLKGTDIWGSSVILLAEQLSFDLHCEGKIYKGIDHVLPKRGCLAEFLKHVQKNSSKWIHLPTLQSNGATFHISNTAEFTGCTYLQGNLETRYFNLKSEIDSQAMASNIKIHENMKLQGKGNLSLIPAVGDIKFRSFFQHNDNRFNHISHKGLKCGESSNVWIGGTLLTQMEGKILNIGSNLHVHNQHGKNNVKSSSLWTYSFPPSAMINTTRAIPSFWSQNHEFKPSPTTGSIMTISPTNGQVNYSITAPLLFVQYAGDLVLGTSQAGKPTPKPQSVSLTELGLNGYLVQYNDRPIQIETHSPCSTPFQFMFRPKFWYDDKQAQSFYKDIFDSAFVMHNDGFEKLKKGCLLSLTPDLLIEKVREACQKTLNRPYLEISMNSEENKITEKVVRQLHLNMFEYLKEQGEKALLWQDLKHPVLYYVGLQNQFGQCEFSPHIRFPQKMIDQANGTQIGTNIVGNFMAVLPAGMSLQDFLGICQMHPPILKYVTNLLETNPRVANGMLKALESVTPEPVSQDIVPVNSSSTLARTSPENNLTIHGNVNMETAVAISKNDLVIDGDIQGINGLFAALHDLWIISRKERRSFHENGWYGFKDVLTVKAAINMIKNLTLTSGRHTTSVGAYTRGGESQPINTGGQFRPQPLILEMEANRNSHGKNWAREEHKSSSTPVPSSHYGYHLPITTGEGVNGNGVELGGNTAVIIAENNDIRLNPAIKTDSYSSHTSSTDDGIFFSSTDHHYHNSFTSTSIPSTLNFPGGIHAITNGKEDKLELEHTDFNTVQGTIAESYNISIRPGTERQEISNHSISSDFFRTTVEGNNTRIVRHPSGIITGPFTPRTPSGDRSRNPRVSITTVAGEETPEYLKALRLLKNIELIESTVRDEHHYNSYSHSYLSP